jgi:hypothetical protein
VYLQRVPQLVGRTFGTLAFHLPMATVYGIVQFASRRCLLLPPLDTVLQACSLSFFLPPQYS